MRAFRNLADLDEPDAFVTWLRRIVITVSVNIRKSNRVTMLRLDDLPVMPVLDEAETSWSEAQRRLLLRHKCHEREGAASPQSHLLDQRGIRLHAIQDRWNVVGGISGRTPRSGVMAGRSGIGARPPFARVPANVPSPFLCRPPSMQTARVHNLRPGKPPEGQLDGGEGNEGGQGFRQGSRSPWRDAGFVRTKRRCARPPSGAAGRRSPSCRRSA